MKQKDNIVPPSKSRHEDTSNGHVLDQLREEFDRKQANKNQLEIETRVLAERIEGEEYYETSVPEAAEALNIDKALLERAFEGNKGELVKKFNQYKSNGMLPSSLAVSACAAGAAFFGYIGVTTDTPALFFSSACMLVSVAIFGSITAKEVKRCSKIKKSIQNQVTEHQKRLADMRTPNPA